MPPNPTQPTQVGKPAVVPSCLELAPAADAPCSCTSPPPPQTPPPNPPNPLHTQVGKPQSDDPEEESKQKQFKGILNKLTPDNFEKLTAKIFEVGIEQAKTLVGLIDQVRGLEGSADRNWNLATRGASHPAQLPGHWHTPWASAGL